MLNSYLCLMRRYKVESQWCYRQHCGGSGSCKTSRVWIGNKVPVSAMPKFGQVASQTFPQIPRNCCIVRPRTSPSSWRTRMWGLQQEMYPFYKVPHRTESNSKDNRISTMWLPSCSSSESMSLHSESTQVSGWALAWRLRCYLRLHYVYYGIQNQLLLYPGKISCLVCSMEHFPKLDDVLT